MRSTEMEKSFSESGEGRRFRYWIMDSGAYYASSPRAALGHTNDTGAHYTNRTILSPTITPADSMTLLLVEDDPLQSSLIVERLKKEWSDVTVEVIETEAAFRHRLPEIAKHAPDVVILDVMLSW